MNTSIIEKWKDKISNLNDELLQVSINDPDGGIRKKILILWHSISTAPSTIIHEYSSIPEEEILNNSENYQFDSKITLLNIKNNSSVKDILLEIGSYIRGLERLLLDYDTGSLPVNPNEEWKVEYNNDCFYIIPIERISWRTSKKPHKDRRPFSQRGVTRVRIIPITVGGANVKIYLPDIISHSSPQKFFGAALFPNIKFDEHKNDKCFRVTEVTSTELNEVIDSACRNAHSDSCSVVVFPELTINSNSLNRIKGILAEKPWMDESKDSFTSPSIVVAGSWHTQAEEGYVNESTILDGYGDLILSYKKRYAYKDQDGLSEEITPGNELSILVLEHGLFAFGICLDFCNRAMQSPYEQLDVDYIIVPSCGNELTMAGHIRTADDLLDQRKTRSFVVQQAYPCIDNGLGYVLPPGQRRDNIKAGDLVTADKWSIYPIEALT